MSHLLGPPVVPGNQVKELINGDEIFPPMLAAIRAAEKTITFETYIYWSGEIGKNLPSARGTRTRGRRGPRTGRLGRQRQDGR